MSPALTHKFITTAHLRDRAEMLATVRTFFAKRCVLEVDCCSLTRVPSLDANVEAIEAAVSESETGYLHTSPEFSMKKLLSQGLGDIYYLGHVFRKGELGRLHNPEFTMIEWYRTAMSFGSFIEETCSLMMLFLAVMPTRHLSYREALQTHAGIDPTSETFDGFTSAKQLGISLPDNTESWSRDDWLHLLLSHAVEPKLGDGELTVLFDYTPSQAALSTLVVKEGRQVAERFEIYHRGIELSNGYHELTDAIEQRHRFEEENLARQLSGRAPYPLDEDLLAALEKGLPDCCGVSIGFDRLMLLRHNLNTIHEILPFSWESLNP
jgi:lysyl-tRNA synthetase class 2